MEADRVVVELIAKVENFDGKMKQSATSFGGSMKSIETSAVKAEAAVKASSAALSASVGKDAESVAHLSKVIEAHEKRKQAALAVASAIASLEIENTKKVADAHTKSTALVVQAEESKSRALVLYTGKNVAAHNAQSTAATKSGEAAKTSAAVAAPAFSVISERAQLSSRAMGFVVAGASVLGSVIGSLLVTALLSGAAALYEFLTKNKDAAKEVAALVEKMKEAAAQARLNEQANAVWERSLDGLIEKTRKLREEQEKQLQTDRQRLEGDVAARQDELQTSRQLRDDAARDLETAKAELAKAEAALREALSRPGRAQEGAQAATAQRVQAAKDEVARLTTELQKATVQAGSANEALHNSEVILARMNAANLADPIKAIADNFETLRAEAIASIKPIDQLTKRLAELDKQEAEALEKARTKTSTDREVGGSLTSEEARSLVNAQFGAGAVTSGRRSAQHNKDVGGQPNSFHLTGNAIDVAKVAGVSLNKLKALISAQGVIIEEALDEGDHFHIAWRSARTQAERLAAEQKKLADAEANRVQAVDREQAGFGAAILDAKRQLLESSEEIAANERAQVDLASDLYADEVKHRLTVGALHEDEAKDLLKLNDERAKLLKEAIQRRVDERKFRVQEAEAGRKVDLQTGEIGVQQELLQSRQGLATTARERHDLERRLIDLAFDQERLELQAVIAGSERLRIELERLETLRALSDEEKAALRRAQDQAALAQQRLDTQPERQANAQSGNDQANATPLQDFFGQIPNTADEINESFEQIAAGGLASFTDGLTDAILGMRSLGDVGRQVLAQILAGLIKMGIQQVLLATIGKAVQSATTAAGAAEGATLAAAWAPAAAAVSLATLGANAIPAQAAIASTNILAAALAAPKGFQLGGYTGDGAPNRPAGIVHGREFVFDAPATRRIGVQNLEAMRSGVRPSNARAASPGGGGGRFSAQDMAALESIVGRAIEAMPDVGITATFDPDQAFNRMISSKAGSRRLLAWLNDNSSAASSALSQ